MMRAFRCQKEGATALTWNKRVHKARAPCAGWRFAKSQGRHCTGRGATYGRCVRPTWPKEGLEGSGDLGEASHRVKSAATPGLPCASKW